MLLRGCPRNGLDRSIGRERKRSAMLSRQNKEDTIPFFVLLGMLLAVSFPGAGQNPPSGSASVPSQYGTPQGAGQATISPAGGPSSSAATAPGVTTQSPFQGSVPTGQPTGTTLALS